VKTRRVLGFVFGALAAGGCSGVLGMDAPTLDPCVQGGCFDAPGVDVVGGDVTVPVDAPPEAPLEAPADAPVSDVQAEAPPEAAACVDAAIPADAGGNLRCGGGCWPVTFCTGTQVCCESTSATGTTTFACVANESACNGYAIKCVNEDDCGGSDVCCRFLTHMVCDTAANCPNDQLGCIPGSPQDCPAGKACDVSVVLDDGGVTTPYLTCHP
jgi:hypothetical protein